MEITIDFETRSTIDLKKCGMYVYWQSPYTEVMMLSVKVDDAPTLVWIPEKFRHLKDTEVSDEELERLTSSTDHIIAHNAGFERQGFKYGMTKLGFSDIPLEKVRCTQAQSLACALPRDLDSVAKIATGGKYLKDKEGHNLMLKMSKPRALVKAECLEISKTDWKKVKKLQAEFLKRGALGEFTEQDKERFDQFLKYREDKEDFERLVEYARQDVEVERKIYKQLPKLSPYEQKVWVLDQQINDRGIFVDRKNCEKIENTVAVYTKKLSKKALEITGNRVTSVKSPKSILSWLRDNGLDFTSVDKESVEVLLSLEIPSHVREFLEIKQKVGKSSVAKYDALLNYSLGDGRFRGGMSYHVATTGRWGGNGPQPQNFPRPSENNFVKCSDRDTRKEVFADEKDIRLLTSQDFDLIECFWKDPMVLAADLIRPMLIAPEGKDFICADFSAVEGRGLAWLAGQEDKLQAYREGKDLYKVAASAVYKIPYEEIDGGGKGPQRQTGKTAELACFSADTEVLTDTGWRNINSITKEDKLWDGESWVSHEGVIFSGWKKTVTLDGTRPTPEHLIFDGLLWKQAIELERTPSYLKSALRYGASSYLTLELNNVMQGIESLNIKLDALIAGMNTGYGTKVYSKTKKTNALTVSVRGGLQLIKGLSVDTLSLKKGRKSGNSRFYARIYAAGKQTPVGRIIKSLSNVVAELNRIGLTKLILEKGRQPDAINVLGKKLVELLAIVLRTEWYPYAKMCRCGGGCTTLLKRKSKDVTTLTIGGIKTMAVEELNSSLKHLETQLRGISHYLTAAERDTRSIELTMTDTMKRETSGSLQEANKQEIGEQCGSLRPKLNAYEPVYDILNAEENHRFLIRSKSGYLVVSNCGYGGSVGAMMRFNADKLGLTEPEMKSIVKAWRKANDKIVKFWYELRDASLDAMRFPGDRIKAGKVSFRKRGNFLTLRLPSGRDLYYPQARIEETEFSYENDEGEIVTKKQKLVTAMTLTSAKQWVRRPLSHVTLSENATQATCRDLLVNGMFNVETAGYPIVLHVHDEILSEVDEGKGNLKEFEELMAKLPEWAEGLPLKADGWIGKFYQK